MDPILLEREINYINRRQLTVCDLNRFGVGMGSWSDADGGVAQQTQHIMAIINALQRCPQVTTLDLNSNDIDVAGVNVLVGHLPPQITTLILDCNNLLNDGCIASVSAPYVQRLSLLKNSINEMGAREILKALSPSLIELRIPCSNISGPMQERIQKKIQENIEAHKQTSQEAFIRQSVSITEISLFSDTSSSRGSSDLGETTSDEAEGRPGF